MDDRSRPKSGYCLRLGDNAHWCLTAASKDLWPWIDKLAGIMELEACTDDAGGRLVFSCDGVKDHSSGCIETGETCNSGNWKCHHMNTLSIWHHDDFSDVICRLKPFDGPETEIISMWNTLYPIYRGIVTMGGLPLHAGLVEMNGRGVVIAGPGNTGKSTCCARLPDNWNPLCDDEALVIRDGGGNYRAHPFPSWSDYLWRDSERTFNVNYSVPVSGIFFIERSEIDAAVPLDRAGSAAFINESAVQVCRKYWSRADAGFLMEFRKDLFGNACDIAKRTPAFRLGVDLHGKFWEEIERVLGW